MTTAARAHALAHKTSTPIELERRHGARNYDPLKVVLERGQDVWLFDTAGRRYLDMMSAYSAVSFGHANPTLVSTLTEQAKTLAVTSRAPGPRRPRRSTQSRPPPPTAAPRCPAPARTRSRNRRATPA